MFDGKFDKPTSKLFRWLVKKTTFKGRQPASTLILFLTSNADQ